MGDLDGDGRWRAKSVTSGEDREQKPDGERCSPVDRARGVGDHRQPIYAVSHQYTGEDSRPEGNQTGPTTDDARRDGADEWPGEHADHGPEDRVVGQAAQLGCERVAQHEADETNKPKDGSA